MKKFSVYLKNAIFAILVSFPFSVNADDPECRTALGEPGTFSPIGKSVTATVGNGSASTNTGAGWQVGGTAGGSVGTNTNANGNISVSRQSSTQTKTTSTNGSTSTTITYGCFPVNNGQNNSNNNN